MVKDFDVPCAGLTICFKQEVILMLLRAFVVSLVAMCSLLASQTAPQPGQPAPQPGQPAPDFTLPDSAGSPIKLSAYKGKVVLLDFWATWCEGCKVEIPWYVEFQDKYRN